MSGDVAVQECPVPWQVPPPYQVPRGGMFTVVGRFHDRIVPQIMEAFALDDAVGEAGVVSSRAIGERFYGNYEYTHPGFNDDEGPSTYVWFNVIARRRGLARFRFRLTWRIGHAMFGSLDTFEVEVRGNKFRRQIYCTEQQDLLALLEPQLYDPTPVELMAENARDQDAPGVDEDSHSDHEAPIKTEPDDGEEDVTLY